MQSFLIFTAEFQAAKRRLLNNLEASDDGRLSVESDEGGRAKTSKFSENTPMYESTETTSHGVLPDMLRSKQN